MFFRVKVALIAAVLMAVATAGSVVYVSSTLNESITQRIEKQVEHAEQSLLRSARLEAVELTTVVATLAREDEFAQIFTKTTEDDRRRSAFVAVEARQARMEQRDSRKAAIVAVLDKNGKVVARDLNINSLYGEDLKTKYPSIATALGGTANKDIWNFDGQMYRVGAAPIRGAAGEVVGALVVGYVQSVQDARADKERLGMDLAYFLDGKIQGSSFSRGEGQSSESVEEKALAAQLFAGKADEALAARQATPPFRVKIGGQEWIAAAAPLPGNTTKSKSGFVVLTSLSAATAFVPAVIGLVLAVGLLGVVLILAAALLTARRFLRPLDKIESGVSEVINGNQDYTFESPSPDFEGLANGLNVMLARLLGRPEPGEEDEAGDDEEGGRRPSRFQGDALFVDEGSTVTTTAAAMGGAEAAALSEEPADAYYARLWSEYAAARQQTGEGVQGLSAEQFVAKLKQNEAALAKKYNARMVRFKVQIKNNQTTLKPVPLN